MDGFCRLNSKVLSAHLDSDALSKLQEEKAELSAELVSCMKTAQSLDDSLTPLGLIVHGESPGGTSTQLHSQADQVGVRWAIGCMLRLIQ